MHDATRKIRKARLKHYDGPKKDSKVRARRILRRALKATPQNED